MAAQDKETGTEETSDAAVDRQRGNDNGNRIPMRKASTLPDLSRYQQAANQPSKTGTTSDDDGAESHPVSRSAQNAPETTPAPDTTSASDKTPAPDKTSAPATQSFRTPAKDAHRRASERDEAVNAKPLLPRVLQVLLAVIFPFVVLAASVRAVTSSVFLWLEYHRPGFPDDSYGFSTEDRMTYGSYTVDYILNFAPPRYLGDLVGPEGRPLFLESEVGHMHDVKMVLATGFLTALVLLVVAVICCIYLALRYSGGVRRGLFAGAVSTLVLMVALTVVAVLGWERFFTLVHQVFFSEGTWTFRLDDTLIRLFPSQFWLDAGIVIAALVLLVSLVTLVVTWPSRRRRERSKLAQEERRRRQAASLESGIAAH